MGGYIGAKTGTISVATSASNITGDISATDATPELTLKNTTETDADGSRSSKIIFKGEQSGGEESVLAQIQGSHDGTSDDEKGDLIFKTNDGSDGASPTERLRIDSAGAIIPATLGTDNVHLGEGAGAAIVSGGNNNVAIGKDALASNTTADNSTAVGFEAGTNSTGAQNTFLGRQTGKGLTSGTESVFIGNGAGRDGTSTGSYNIGIGSVSLNALTSGHSNIAIGRDSLGANTTGVKNVVVGYQAADAITDGEMNVAIGNEALSAETGGDKNVAVGASALKALNNNGAAFNTAVGTFAGTAVSTGTHNTLIGGQAGDAITTGGDNVAVGAGAAGELTSGYGNVAVGRDSLDVATTGNYNTAVGRNALGGTTTGYQNVGVGYSAGVNNTTGFLTCLGYNAGTANTTGSIIAIGNGTLASSTTATGVIGIGNGAGQSHTTQYGSTYIGHLAGYNSTGQNTCIGYASCYSGNGATSLTSGGGNTVVGGYTGVAAATNHSSIVIGHSAVGKGSQTGYIGAIGGVYQGNNYSTWSQTSDRRLKKNITDSSIGLAEINQLKVRNFEYKTKDDLSEIESDGLVEADIIESSGVQVGAIAQEIQAVLPKCVTEQDTGVLSLSTDNLTWHLVKAVQELSAKNDALEARIVTLEG